MLNFDLQAFVTGFVDEGRSRAQAAWRETKVRVPRGALYLLLLWASVSALRLLP